MDLNTVNKSNFGYHKIPNLWERELFMDAAQLMSVMWLIITRWKGLEANQRKDFTVTENKMKMKKIAFNFRSLWRITVPYRLPCRWEINSAVCRWRVRCIHRMPNLGIRLIWSPTDSRQHCRLQRAAARHSKSLHCWYDWGNPLHWRSLGEYHLTDWTQVRANPFSYG